MDEETLTRLRYAISGLARQLGRDSPDEGMTPTQAVTLGAIAHRGPISLSRLARTEGLHASLLSRIVRYLERNELITRTQDPDDMRSHIVEATAKGKETAARIRNNRSAVLAEATRVLSEAEEQQVADALPALEKLVVTLLAE
ncbi:MAG: MarR family transcriptional regulator [Nocardioides sp.]|uniref:MarR family winged helix-turn-helix transcriptional regulator n=1 Tax=Nocardioides sp. TaxID=35761 RepID=UPI0039E463DD